MSPGIAEPAGLLPRPGQVGPATLPHTPHEPELTRHSTSQLNTQTSSSSYIMTLPRPAKCALFPLCQSYTRD